MAPGVSLLFVVKVFLSLSRRPPFRYPIGTASIVFPSAARELGKQRKLLCARGSEKLDLNSNRSEYNQLSSTSP